MPWYGLISTVLFREKGHLLATELWEESLLFMFD